MASKRAKGKAPKAKPVAAKKGPPKKKPAPKPAKRPAPKAKPPAPKAKGNAPKAKPAAKQSQDAPRAKQVAGPRAATPALEAISRIADKWPTLTSQEVLAFDSLFPASQCDAIGRKTTATEVRDEAVRWIVNWMDPSLRAYSGGLAAYSPARFAYFLLTARRLCEQIDAEVEAGKRGSTLGVRDRASQARAAALVARDQVIERLATFVGGRANERAELQAALGNTDTGEQLARSLRALAHLQVGWLELTDPSSRILAASAGLSEANAEELRAHAIAVSAKTAEATLGGALRAGDSPEVNRIEGRLVLEMREARRIFNPVHEKNNLINKLSPGPALRSVLGTQKRGAEPNPPPAPDAADAPEPAAPDAPSSPT